MPMPGIASPLIYVALATQLGLLAALVTSALGVSRRGGYERESDAMNAQVVWAQAGQTMATPMLADVPNDAPPPALERTGVPR